MSARSCLLWTALLLLVPSCSHTAAPKSAAAEPTSASALDLADTDDRARAFLITRGALDPQAEVVFAWSGEIFAHRPADPLAPATTAFDSPLLLFEGFNVARFVPTERGHRMLSREVSFYLDTQGNLLDCFHNTLLETAQFVSVAHVYNDPVNFDLRAPPMAILGDHVAFFVDVSLSYPSPLPASEFTRYSSGNTYQSKEMFNFFVARADLIRDPAGPLPVHLSWTRVGPFLPWMQMGQQPGGLVYHARGHKVLGGFAALSERLKRWVAARAPQFAHAPSADEGKNATSWSTFAALLEAGAYQQTCTPSVDLSGPGRGVN